MYLYQIVLRGLQAKVNVGQGAGISQGFQQRFDYSYPPGHVRFTWSNRCERQYGSWEDFIPIVGALELITTVRGIMPPQYQNCGCIYGVFRHMGPGAERVFVGIGEIAGTPEVNEVE